MFTISQSNISETDMKPTKLFVVSAMLTVLFLLCACQGANRRRLDKAAAIVDTASAEALHQLDSIERPASLRGEDAARYALLRTQAGDKCDVPVTTDSLIRIAVNYYQGSDPFQSAMSYYYLGRVCYYLSQSDSAIHAFVRARDLFPDHHNRYYKLCLMRLGNEFNARVMPKNSEPVYQECRALCMQDGNEDIIEDLDFNEGKAYLFDGNIFSRKTKEKAYKLFESIVNRKKLYYSGYLQEAYFYMAEIDFYTFENYKKAAEELELSIATSIDKSKLTGVYNLKAEIFKKANRLDSAEYYYKLPLKKGDLYTDACSYDALIRLFMRNNKIKEANEILDKYEDTKDSICNKLNQSSVKELLAKHTVELHDQKLAEDKIRYKARMAIMLVTFIFISITAVYIWERRKRMRFIRLQNELASVKVEMTRLKAARVEAEQQDTYDATENERRMLELTMRKLYYCTELFHSSPTFKKLENIERNHLQAAETLPLELRDKLSTEIYATFSDFISDLQSQGQNLDDTDILLCVLSSLNYSIRTISNLAAISESALRMRKTRLRQKLLPEAYDLVFAPKRK
jgi:tetratricopeptide (TPR) repeat protein